MTTEDYRIIHRTALKIIEAAHIIKRMADEPGHQENNTTYDNIIQDEARKIRNLARDINAAFAPF